MAVNWYLDEGLQRFKQQWQAEHPGAVVYSIGDDDHLSHDSEHNPEFPGSAPGADKGEVDAVDVMPGKGVTEADLDELAEDLRTNRDGRLLYVIRRQRIFSSTVRPWVWRPYSGKYHGHLHMSVNDKYDANRAEWKFGEDEVAKHKFVEVVGFKLPEFKVGTDDDAFEGYNYVARAQVLANYLDKSVPDVDVDGVYGALSARKVQKALRTDSPVNTVDLPVWRGLYGLVS